MASDRFHTPSLRSRGLQFLGSYFYKISKIKNGKRIMIKDKVKIKRLPFPIGIKQGKDSSDYDRNWTNQTKKINELVKEMNKVKRELKNTQVLVQQLAGYHAFEDDDEEEDY